MKRDVTELLSKAHTETMQALFLAGITQNAELIPEYYSKAEAMTILEQLDYYTLCDTDETLKPIFDKAYIFLTFQIQRKYPDPYVREVMRIRQERKIQEWNLIEWKKM